MLSAISIDSDAEVIAQAVRDLSRRTRFPVAFGGLIEDGAVAVTSIVGTRTRSLEGLHVRPERGLGGRALTELRPRMTSDYRSSRQITHDYDGYILGEGLRTLLALPIVVGGRPRGVLYAGAWEQSPVGGVTTAPAMSVAESVATELRIRDEVERRMRTLTSSPPPSRSAVSPAYREELRAGFAELRRIADSVSDDDARERLDALQRRLVATSGLAEPIAPTGRAADGIRLSPRETDVLACAALGATNAEIADQLGLRVGTVKAYLGTAMSKLDSATRHAAVAKARRIGLLP